MLASLVGNVAAGEYAADGYDAARLAPVVDCLQLDATRCGGYTGWRRAAGIAAAHILISSRVTMRPAAV
jgi:L-alanine-DL-glutamate epimerase-like enolase superfamily enzyme